MSYVRSIVIEGIAVGIGVILVGTLISYLIAIMRNKNTKFLKNPWMIVGLFLTGFILHVGLDVAGLNKWYCKNCAGCR
tara:strand:- start:238 stop:471 length:234 start_codon:yes stop_codon:yes gene_type:complete